MIERYINFLGMDETIKLLEANERPLTPSIRVNTLKIGVHELKKRLENKGFNLEPIEWVPYGFKVLNEPLNLGSLHENLQGYFYLQNIASMLPPIILEPKSNETVIDMCAAPGGKATHLAQIMNNKGNLILIERNQKRIPALEINLRRMGIKNSIVLNLDATNISSLNIKADKILLDAPCTGEGLIREDKSRKRSKKLKDINKMASIQKNLLEAGLNSLKMGGRLLYSTCSTAPEENEFVINEVLNKNSQFLIIKIKNQFGVHGFTEIFGKTFFKKLELSQRFFPHIHNTIGFFVCLIERMS
ncbi:MAG: RsmB/NOP family class I SAM-dependent RNA methyltransferase [Promethearchaeota archaeon]|nr:MAG: RsmB/NOP family class I SAM-dependent RNA methyltransferase [Candidatus Lokiarchaeota archaeon]